MSLMAPLRRGLNECLLDMDSGITRDVLGQHEHFDHVII